MDRLHHSINLAAKRSGLTPHVIRVWERRYQAVKPVRTPTNRRLYSDTEIERLTLLRQAVSAGYRIGNIAVLSADDLRGLLTSANAAPNTTPGAGAPSNPTQPSEFSALCLDAVRRMDANGLEDALTRALIVLGHQGLLRKIIAPLTQGIGARWQEGSLSAAHEHFASSFLRNFLGHGSRPFATGDSAPTLVVATPSGQLHEMGAVIITSAARNLGWRVLHLGANLPAAEIAGAAIQHHARAVALSIVYPADDPELPQELAALRRFLPTTTKILVGGRAAEAYRDAVNQIGASTADDLDVFVAQLDALRTVRSPIT